MGLSSHRAISKLRGVQPPLMWLQSCQSVCKVFNHTTNHLVVCCVLTDLFLNKHECTIKIYQTNKILSLRSFQRGAFNWLYF